MKKLLLASCVLAVIFCSSCEAAKPWAIREAGIEMGMGAIMESPVTRDIIDRVPALAD